MLPALLAVADYKLTDLLSAAGATIGIIIAGTIFLSFVNAKYMGLSGRYREIACEYRGVPCDHNRHGPLNSQIRVYRRRLSLLNRAASIAAVALLCLLASVLCGGLSMLFPPVVAIRTIGTVALMAGLPLIGVAVTINLAESILARKEIGYEIADLEEEVRGLPC